MNLDNIIAKTQTRDFDLTSTNYYRTLQSGYSEIAGLTIDSEEVANKRKKITEKQKTRLE